MRGSRVRSVLALATAALAVAGAGSAPKPAARPRFAGGTEPYTATARIFPTEELHRIPDEIYGVCVLPRAKLAEYRIPVTRWGGNPSSRYNWKINADNGASDWFFMNRRQPAVGHTETGYLRHIRANQDRGATTYQTVPMLGWVAKDAHAYGFSVAKYGPQQKTEPWHPDAGNGVRPDGKPVTGNDPHDTSVEAPPAFIEEAVRYVVQHAGPADRGGVRYWALDNEPMLWNATHRDVHPEPPTYAELWDRTVRYAEAIKRADPTAKVAGFCSWGWMDLFYSAADAGTDRYRTKPDWQAHGKVPLAVWFLDQCAAYKRKHGKPLIDVFDVHWYPQGEVGGQGPYLGKGMDLPLNRLRLRSTRDLWDPGYEQESWIRRAQPDARVALLRRVRRWAREHNPGMEVCLGEYNFGGDNITGGLAQADVFGLLARERADLAFIWTTPEGTQELAWKLFRSYDGHRHGFGDRYVRSESDRSDLSIFAARRSADRAVTAAVINKDLHAPCTLDLDLGGLAGELRVWRFDQDTGDRVVEARDQAGPVRGRARLTVPAASASMVVVTPNE